MKQFAGNFETALAISDRHGLKIMPVLFNRWHTNSIDYGGIYIDHVLPGSRNYVHGLFESYMEDIADAHAQNEGAFSSAGDLAFIKSNGELRPGHQVVNKFGSKGRSGES